MSPLFSFADNALDSNDEQKTAQARAALLADADKAPAAATTTADIPPPTHIALAIGNGAYRETNRLANPVNDARRIAQALRDIKFDVTAKEDLDYAVPCSRW